jgi:AbiV family abortive infection protein
MAKRKINQYKSTLTAAQIADGMNAAAANAKRLYEDAKLLFESSRYPSSLALSSLSIEESGKLSILRSLALARNQGEVEDTWREYRTHTRKNMLWPFLDLVSGGARKLSDFRPLVLDGADHPSLMDNIKQLGFYTDCLGNAHWSNPSDVIDATLAESILRIAEFLLPKHNVTEKEIKLWIKHLKPVWKQDMEIMEAALVSWHRAMHDAGLMSGDPSDMEKFIIKGLEIKNDT